ncbi:MAG: phosphoribosylamine--glycine ligase, partial [Treponema sp.]|nr:phosphoribosylamine--glycine ligase [Treponema sp.]
MKILIIGSGGREHVMAWKLAQSKKVEKIFVAPGNGGTAAEEKTENLSIGGANPLTEEGQKTLIEFAKKENIVLTVVGPEAPLAAGFADRFRAAGLAIVGPGEKAARLETSKAYAKSFMAKHGVCAAKSRNFTVLAEAIAYAEKQSPPLVIKADGLAAGKGVVIAADMAEAKETLSAFMEKGVLGEAGKSVIIEDFIKGPEVSVLAAVSVNPAGSKNCVIKPFLSARDHKRRFEGGLGPNTGGMGAIAPVPDFTPALQ